MTSGKEIVAVLRVPNAPDEVLQAVSLTYPSAVFEQDGEILRIRVFPAGHDSRSADEVIDDITSIVDALMQDVNRDDTPQVTEAYIGPLRRQLVDLEFDAIVEDLKRVCPRASAHREIVDEQSILLVFRLPKEDEFPSHVQEYMEELGEEYGFPVQ